MAAEAGSPKRSVLVWLVASAGALALLVGVLAVATGDDDAAPTDADRDAGADAPGRLSAMADGWEALPAPPLPAGAVANGNVALTGAAGRLLAVSEGGGLLAQEVWVLDGGAWSAPEAVPGLPRVGATIVGTPRELVVWGGRTGEAVASDGYAFDPVSRTWRRLDLPPAPAGSGAVGLWTGREVLVVGGNAGDPAAGGTTTSAVAVAYDPDRESWRALPPADGLVGTIVMASAWTGERVVVWAYDEAARESRLLALDAAAGEEWTGLPPPPFLPAAGASGLAGDRAGLVATTTEFGAPGAAVLDEAGLAWRALAAPPVPPEILCSSDLVHGGAGTVLLSRCTGELFLLDGTAWHRLPALPGTAAGGRPGAQALVTDEAVYYLAPASAGAPGAAPSLLRLALR